MVTYTEVSAKMPSGKLLIEGNCLSTDTKPTQNIANGSVMIEMDTSTMYFFDEATSTWRAWS